MHEEQQSTHAVAEEAVAEHLAAEAERLAAAQKAEAERMPDEAERMAAAQKAEAERVADEAERMVAEAERMQERMAAQNAEAEHTSWRSSTLRDYQTCGDEHV